MANLFRIMAQLFVAMWDDVWSALTKHINPLIDTISAKVKSKYEFDWDAHLKETIDGFAAEDDIPEDSIDFLKQYAKLPFPSDIICIIASLIFMGLGILSRFLGIYGAKASWSLMGEVRPTLLDPATLASYIIKNPDRTEDAFEYMDFNGLNQEQKDILILSMQRHPEITLLLDMRNRGIIDDTDLNEGLVRLGYDNDDSKKVSQLRNFVPSISDLTMLAGRDQFEEDTIREFDLQSGYPEVLTEWGAKIGVSRDLMLKYWGAHWYTPSISQAFVMLQREVITQEQLDVFFNLADISPFFRDKLLQIAYLPYSRVDTRRMHQMGTLTDDQLIKAYKDQGYDQEHATNLAEFTIEYNSRVDKDLTKTQVGKLYEQGFIDSTEYQDFLQELGYDNQEAYYHLQLLDNRIEEERLKSYLDSLETLYKRQNIDEAGLIAYLGQLNIKATRVDYLVRKWNNEMITESRLPTKEDVLKWLATGVVDRETFIFQMRELGFMDRDVSYYLIQEGQDPISGDINNVTQGLNS